LIALWQEQTERPVNLVLTPHTGFYSESSLVEMRVKAADEVARALTGRPLRNCVNRDWLSGSKTG
jgi:lactate dehydrogenase-like 2-hydroxyacid dehydrogenase